MAFVQLIDCKTSRVEDVNRLMDSWAERTKGKRTATHSVVAKDRSDANHVVEIVEFPSYEEAMRNSRLPETDRIFQELVALCDEAPTFTDLDVVRDEQLNKEICHRYFDEVISSRNYDIARELCSSDYQEHDPANRSDPLPFEESLESTRQYLEAFRPRITIESQVAEGDLVTTRWSARGSHVGEFMGMQPTNREISLTGHTTHRLSEGKIAESWWNWDTLGALTEIGAIEQ